MYLHLLQYFWPLASDTNNKGSFDKFLERNEKKP